MLNENVKYNSMKIIYNFVWYKLKIEILFYQPFGYVAWNCILYSTIAFNDHIMKKKMHENTRKHCICYETMHKDDMQIKK